MGLQTHPAGNQLPRSTGAGSVAYLRTLLELASAQAAAPFKSVPGQRYDFYYDLVVRHLPMRGGDGPVALRAARGELRYGAVHARCTALVAAWQSLGLKPGDGIAIVLNMGEELLCSVLAALRMGLRVSVLPPLGPLWLERRLRVLKPVRVATEPRYLPLLERFVPLYAPVSVPPPEEPVRWRSHGYLPESQILSLFSPLASREEEPAAVSAEEAFLGMLRDGLVTFGLRPGDALAAPGLPLLAYQPALLLCTMLHGSTFVSFSLSDIATAPERLDGIRALILSDALRDQLLAQGRPLRRIARILRDAAAIPIPAYERWRRFFVELKASEIPVGNLVYDAGCGGAVLTSPLRTGEVTLEAAPVEGRPFSLLDLNRSGQAAVGGIGLLSLSPLPLKQDAGDEQAVPKDPPAPTPPLAAQLLLSSGEGGAPYLQYLGTLQPLREGLPYPERDVAAAAQMLPSIAGTVVVPTQPQGSAGRAAHTLLVFTGARSMTEGAESAGRKEELIAHLVAQIGSHARPDRIEFLPLYPRRRGGAIDVERVRSDYLQGGLHRSTRLRSVQLLTALRGLTTERLSSASSSGPGETGGTQ